MQTFPASYIELRIAFVRLQIPFTLVTQEVNRRYGLSTSAQYTRQALRMHWGHHDYPPTGKISQAILATAKELLVQYSNGHAASTQEDPAPSGEPRDASGAQTPVHE